VKRKKIKVYMNRTTCKFRELINRKRELIKRKRELLKRKRKTIANPANSDLQSGKETPKT
jgi:hypothetical protein